MAFRVLSAADAFWRPSNQMGVLNTDLAKQLGAATLGARLWRLRAAIRASPRRLPVLLACLSAQRRSELGADQRLQLRDRHGGDHFAPPAKAAARRGAAAA